MRINRIRLEFKEAPRTPHKPRADLVLIESDWNLKQNTVFFLRYCFQVLIESDWNLKILQGDWFAALLCVLIESDWNLKWINERFYNILNGVLIESDWNLKLFCFRSEPGTHLWY